MAKRKRKPIGEGVYVDGERVFHRQQVPSDLQLLLGRSVIETTLSGTHVEVLAEARRLKAQFKSKFADIRANGVGAAAFEALSETPTAGGIPAQIRQAALVQVMTDDVERKSRHSAEMQGRLEALGGARNAVYLVRTGDHLATEWESVEAALFEATQNPDFDEEKLNWYLKMARALRMEATKVREEQQEAKEIVLPIVQPKAKKSANAISIIEQLRRDHRKLSPKTTRKADLYMRRFVEIIGDKAIDAVTKEDVRLYRDTLTKLPQAARGRVRLTVAQQMKLSGPPLDGEAIAKHLDWLKALMAFAVQEGYREANPATGIGAPATSKKTSDSRAQFSKRQLKDIFGLIDSKWRGGSHKQIAYRHIVRLLACTGARPGEIGQLKKSDVFQDDEGVWTINITDAGDDQSLKTEESLRTVPIAQMILDDGEFLEFWRNAPEGPLWHSMDDAGVVYAAGYGERCSQMFHAEILTVLPSCQLADGSKDPRLTLNSLRHGFIGTARKLGIDGDIRRRLTGHTKKTTGGAHEGYGDQLAPVDLKPIVDQIAAKIFD